MQRMGMFGNMPDIIKNLVIINALMFLASWLLPDVMNINLTDMLGLHYFGESGFRPYQIFTHLFMHANLPHIFFNMFSLISLGSILERVWGGKRFLFFYLFCGIGAGLVHLGVEAIQVHHLTGGFFVEDNFVASQEKIYSLQKILSIAVGASGAIYGVMIAFAFLFPNTELIIMLIPIPVKAKFVVLLLIAYDLIAGVTAVGGFSLDNVAHFAHLGGGLFGFLLVYYWQRNKTNLY